MRTFTKITRTFGTTAFALALVAQTFIAGSAYGQYSPTGKDGVTASPRVRQQLDEKASPAPVASAAMACAQCKDISVAQRITEPKGVGARALTRNNTKLVHKHLCDGCETAWRVVGTGKAKQMIPAHSCSEATGKNVACCADATSPTDT